MIIAAALLLLAVVIFQWFSQEAVVKLWGPLQFSVHRYDEPGFYWAIMMVEVALAGLLLYLALI